MNDLIDFVDVRQENTRLRQKLVFWRLYAIGMTITSIVCALLAR